jgi:hypothetical protein
MTITRVGNFGGGVNSGSLGLALPGGISLGDAVGAVGVCSSSRTLAAPAGWSVRAGFPVDVGNARFYVYTKDDVTPADSGEAQVWTPDAANKISVAGFVLHSSNGFPTDWTDDLTFEAIAATGSVYTAPASVSTVADTYGVAAFGLRGTDPATWSPAAGLTERIDVQRTGTGATTLHLADSNGSVGGAATTWGPFSESNISTAAGGGLTWLIKENASGGGGGGGGGGGSIYPKCGLWRNWDTDGAYLTRMNAAEEIYGPFQGHWGYYTGTNEDTVHSDVTTAFAAGHDIHIFWKPYDVDWADTAAGNWDTEIDSFAADVISMCSGTGRKIWLTVHHEPENDVDETASSGFETADWRGMWQQVRDRFDAADASQYVTWVAVFMNSHANPNQRFSGPGQGMIDLWGNDGVMDALVDVVSQQDYIVKNTTPSVIATKWLEDLEFLVDNTTANRNWSYLDKPQAFTEWGADLGGGAEDRGTDTHRAQTIDAITGILPDLASRNVVEVRYFDARTDRIVPPPSVDGTAFQAHKVATEQGQAAGPGFIVGATTVRDTETTTEDELTYDLSQIDGWQPGDFAVIFHNVNSNPTLDTVAAGWQIQQGPINNSTVQTAWILYKELVAGEPNPTFITSQSLRGSGICVVVRGIDTADPFAAVQGLTATSNSTSHAAAAITVPEDDCVLLTYWGFRWTGAGGTNYGTVPGSHSQVATVSPNGGANPAAGGLLGALADQPVAAGSYGPYTATIGTTSVGLCGQVALRAAPEPPAPVVSGSGVGSFGFIGTASGQIGAPAVADDVMPAVRVYVAFGSDPMSTAPTYTDITDYLVEPVRIGFGAKDEFSDVEPGTLSFRLKNADGRFTMGRSGGPYGDGVVPGKRIQVVLTYASVAYVRFDGHVNGWPVSWDESLDVPVVDVTATDRMKYLGEIGQFRSMLEQEILQDSPNVYYPLSEPEGAQSVGSIAAEPASAASQQVFNSGGPPLGFGQGTGPGTDSLEALVCTPQGQIGATYLVATRVAVGSSAGAWLSCYFNTSDHPTPNQTAMCALTTQGGEALALGIWIDGQVQIHYHVAGRAIYSNISPQTFNDGRTHHALVNLTRSGGTATIRLYVDGVLRHTGTFDADPLPVYTRVDIGASHVGDSAPYRGTLSHVAAGSGTISAARVAAHAQAGLTGLVGERTDQRLHRLADWAGLPATGRSFQVGDKAMGAQRADGKPPLEAMRDAERVEQGRIFFQGGLFHFQRRSYRYNRSPDVTLDVAAFHVQLPAIYPGDDFGMVNDFEATRPDGAVQRVINEASRDAHGRYTDSLEIAAESDGDARSVAEWRTGTYGSPMVRFPTLSVYMTRLHGLAPSKVTELLEASIGTVVRIENLPEQAPVTDDEQVIEGWEEILGVGIWQMIFNCSPHSVNSVWQLGVSALGVDTRLAL